MRLTKGSKVEVLCHEEAPVGAWICAEVISGNGHTYSVRYDGFRITSEAAVEKVPRKAIRPRAPPVLGADNWVPGDLVEVFHNQFWKAATVMKGVGYNNFFVRLLGSSREFLVHRSHLRVRQCWHDGKWFVVGQAGIDCFERPNMVSNRKLKRRSAGSCDADGGKKMRMMIKDIGHQQMPLPHPLQAAQKVDAFVFPHKIMGENYMHFPIDGVSNICSGSGSGNFAVESPVSVDTVSCASSVGSCSVGNDYCNLSCDSETNHGNQLEDYDSDADSSSGCGHKGGCSVPMNNQLGAESHISELYKYRCILEALYASGPLSWEEESKMMDIRHTLHISDDEHLQVEFEMTSQRISWPKLEACIPCF